MEIYKIMMEYNRSRWMLDQSECYIPDVWYCGRESRQCGKEVRFTNVMVMDLVGRSLGSLLK